jgi:RimJ/RimL family protein N-acetyltransferase
VLIETERLHLRPVTIDDLDDLVALHAEPGVERFMGRFDRPRLVEWIRLAEDDWAEYGYGRVAIIDCTTGRFLGRTGLKRWPEFEETEVGWVLRPDAWGHGVATEAALACAGWGFQNLDVAYLTAMIRPDNARSIAVAKRLGMTPMRPDTLLGDAVIVHSVTRETWTTRESPDGGG